MRSYITLFFDTHYPPSHVVANSHFTSIRIYCGLLTQKINTFIHVDACLSSSKALMYMMAAQ